MAAAQIIEPEDNLPNRNDTPSFSLRQRPQRKMLSMEDELEQIQKCRYIRKTPLQRGESVIVDLDISFLRAKSIDQDAKESNEERRLSNISESTDEVDIGTKAKLENEIQPNTRPNAAAPNPVKSKSPIQPFIVHETQLKRDKLEPILLAEFNEKCSLASNRKPQAVIKRKTKPVSKIDQLYQEVSRAARHADVDLTAAVRSIKEGQEKEKIFQKLQKSDQSLKRWNYIGRLVRSGWLCGKKGRSLKLFEDRKRKRRMNELNLTHLPISYKASMGTLRERQSTQITSIQRRLASSKSLPPVLYHRKSLQSSTAQRGVPVVSNNLHKNVSRTRSLPAINKPTFL